MGFAAVHEFEDVGIPDGVQIGVFAAEEDVDVIAAAVFVFRVQRLMDVADEVQQKL